MLLIAGQIVPSTADPAKEGQALAAAQAWLALVDQGKYEESWNEAAQLFKKAVPTQRWTQSAKAARKPLGKCISREVSTKTYATEVPGAPAGEYVVIQFNSSFDKKKKAVETVTPMLDPDGTWRVSGYYIK